jgi:micrococcal nuclease
LRAAALLAAALLLAGCSEGAELDRLAQIGKGRAVEAPTGELLVMEGGETIRLAGVDAPNRGEPYSDEAQNALEALAVGQEVELLSGGALEDPFGRRLAHVRLIKGRVWAQGELLEAGAVRARTFADNRAMAKPMFDAEARARIAGRGLWALPVYRVKLPAEIGPRDRGFQIVEGRVIRSEDAGFDLDGRVRIEVAPKARADLDRLNRTAASLAGRLVRVRGVVRRDGSMNLDHPEALELLDTP